jgi:pyruvate/2-oxoglutarate dehydrogenase complex dihydrolipoamide acyltransferase (E2) component
MAQLVGTGIDPSYPKGHVVDTPEDGPTYKGLLATGKCVLPQGEESVNPAAKSDYEIAQAIIRGDDLSAPLDREALARFDAQGLDPHEVVASHGGAGAPNPAVGVAPASGLAQLPHEQSGGVDRPDVQQDTNTQHLAGAAAKYAEMSVEGLKAALEEHGIEESQISGTGDRGALTREDVIEALAQADLDAAGDPKVAHVNA